MLHVLLLCALAPSDVALPTLQATDLGYGSATSLNPLESSTHLGLVPGASLSFRLDGGSEAAGLPALLIAGTAPLDPAVPFSAGLLQVDPTSAFVVATGTVDAAGSLEWPVTVPPSTMLGPAVYTQAGTVDAAMGEVKLTNGLDHVITDAAPTVLAQAVKTPHPLGQGFAGATLVVDTALQWAAEWAQAGLAGPLPQVDFHTEFVVMCFAGQKPTGGYSIEVDELVPLSPGVELRTTLIEPHPTCGTTFGVTSPICIVKVDRVAAGTPMQTVESAVFSPPCP